MRKLINKLICLFRGHKWKLKWRNEYSDGVLIQSYPSIKCARCGKIKEELI